MEILEEVDPELAEMFQAIAQGKLKAKVYDTRVFDGNGKEVLLEIGRNDPCPCGSGKKYKKCCLK
jgi:uncharacterized protein YecA (UPF0149 family)